MKKILTVFLLGMASPTIAHDFWIEPSTFAPQKGQYINFTLRVGDDYTGEIFHRHQDHLNSFQLYKAGTAKVVDSIRGEFGKSPAGQTLLVANQSYVAAYTSKFTKVVMKRKKFQEHLETEKLMGSIDLASLAKKSEVTERFQRSAKTLLVFKQTPSKAVDTKLGHTIELVLEQPNLVFESSSKATKVLWTAYFKERPLVNRPVTLFSKSGRKVLDQKFTDQKGQVHFDISKPDKYLIATVTIVPSAGDADFDSYWASSTFQIH